VTGWHVALKVASVSSAARESNLLSISNVLASSTMIVTLPPSPANIHMHLSREIVFRGALSNCSAAFWITVSPVPTYPAAGMAAMNRLAITFAHGVYFYAAAAETQRLILASASSREKKPKTVKAECGCEIVQGLLGAVCNYETFRISIGPEGFYHRVPQARKVNQLLRNRPPGFRMSFTPRSRRRLRSRLLPRR